MEFPKPINSVEKKILKDKEFLIAIKIGRPREGHDEGTIKAHIIQILTYIEREFKDDKDYPNLRLLALLHDIGKLASVEEHQDILLPIASEAENKQLIVECRKFKKKYYLPEDISPDLKKYKYTSHHGYISYKFAQKFLKDLGMLKIILYHDLAVDMRIEFEDKKEYDKILFKKVFSDIDVELYLKFLKCDNNNRIDKTSEWLKKELKKSKI